MVKIIWYNAEPLKRLNDPLGGTRNKSITVGVLNAQQKLTVIMFGKQIGKQGRTNISDVWFAGRARSKTCSNHGNRVANLTGKGKMNQFTAF
ncbi:MAG: hypothetical protein BWY68_00252 [bacterium ADurb.Bin400]|nr:MAG: hypothetical protein BWY68_00252 [bacterium ADurb.Bin400]